MRLVSASVDAYLVSALLISIPWIYQTRKHRHNPPPNASPIRPYISLILLIHTLYILHGLIVSPPPNLFTSLKIPLNTSTDRIREILAHYSGIDLDKGESFPRPLELLLKRLSLFEQRALYVRFGQYVLQTCEYCKTYDEFALYAIPQPLLSYIYEAAFVGLVTIRGTHRERWRTFGVVTTVAAAVFEGYWISTVTIRLPKKGEKSDVVMWHDVLYTLRQILFLTLPLIVHILPGTPPSQRNPFVQLPDTLMHLNKSLTRLHLLKYTRSAVMRVPSLRERAEKWWDEEKKEGEWVLADQSVRQIAEREGYGFGPFSDDEEDDTRGTEGKSDGESGSKVEGKLKASAKMAVKGLLNEGLAFNQNG